MPVQFKNCTPTEALGFPAYFRVTFQRHAIDLVKQLPDVVQGVASKLDPNIAGTVGAAIVYAAGDQSALLLLATTSSVANTMSVQQFVQLLDPTPFFGYWPTFLTAVSIAAIERVSASEILSDDANENARMNANATAEAGDPLSKVEDAIKLALWVVVAVFVAWVLSRLAGLRRGGAA